MIIEKDLGLNRILDQIKYLDGHCIETGFDEVSSNIVYEESGERLGDIAHKNEYGIGVPERSFMRVTIERNQNEYLRLNENLLSEIYQGNLSVNSSMKKVGDEVKENMKSAIVEFDTPRNAPATIQKKGFDAPLIHTGLMLREINSKVKNDNDLI